MLNKILPATGGLRLNLKSSQITFGRATILPATGGLRLNLKSSQITFGRATHRLLRCDRDRF
jgi:hypothetical protein